MGEAKPTPGPWVAVGTGGPWEQRLNIRAAHWGCVASVGVDPSMPHWDGPQRANARLIADAGTVFHETQCTPSQLLERVKELEEALRKISAIEDQMYGPDWQEIEEARGIADTALSKARPNTAEGEANTDSALEDAARARGIKIAEAAKEVECPNCSLRVISNCGSRHGCPMPDIYAAAREQGGV